MDFWAWCLGDNPKYCAKCRENTAEETCLDCNRKPPELLIRNEICLDAHELAFSARDGMSGNLDYSFLGKIMDLMKLDDTEQLETIAKIKRVEDKLKELNKKDKHG